MPRTMHHLRTPEDVCAFAAGRGFKLVETDTTPYIRLPSVGHPTATVGETIVDNGPGAEPPFEVYNTARNGCERWTLNE